MDKKLAIVIPAYKTDFLCEVFECIKNQSCKDFNLYVFDDHSPYDIKGVFDQYFKAEVNCTYYRFEDNLGGKNLAEHWNRCLSHLGTEEWVWLFSDDDLMESTCVEDFYCFNDKNNIDVFRFPLSIIDYDGLLIKHTPDFPSPLCSSDFFTMLYTGKIDARMPEFIFRREKLDSIGGYKVFDLAWRSDNATVIDMAIPNGIYTIPNSKVYWRSSNKNISGTSDNMTMLRKQQATIAFMNWVDLFFKANNINISMNKVQLMRACQSAILKGNKSFSIQAVIKTIHKINFVKSYTDYLLFVAWSLYDYIRTNK